MIATAEAVHDFVVDQEIRWSMEFEM